MKQLFRYNLVHLDLKLTFGMFSYKVANTCTFLQFLQIKVTLSSLLFYLGCISYFNSSTKSSSVNQMSNGSPVSVSESKSFMDSSSTSELLNEIKGSSLSSSIRQ